MPVCPFLAVVINVVSGFDVGLGTIRQFFERHPPEK
jgi:hypothetical protein